MTRAVLALAVAVWAGGALVLAELRWFSRRSLGDRLRPYAVGARGDAVDGHRRLGGLGLDTFAGVLAPGCRAVADRVSGWLGTREPAAVRLRRIHAPVGADAFRMRQLAWSMAGAAGALVAVAVTGLPAVAGTLVVSGTPVVVFGLVDAGLSARSHRWQRRLRLELPVVVEQLAMLVGAGHSVGTALARLADRCQGQVAQDLALVCSRLRQGLTEAEALREWAAVADVAALHRLVPVLSIHREAGDLARILTDEARAVRRDLQRSLVETAERRGQLVWVPVTVAALLPGVVFVVIPFLDAMRLFAAP